MVGDGGLAHRETARYSLTQVVVGPPGRDRPQSGMAETVADGHYLAIVEKILRDLDGQVEPWKRPWNNGVEGDQKAGGVPLRATGVAYGGRNAVRLREAARRDGRTLPTWMTAEEARSYNGAVRQGEWGEAIRGTTGSDGTFLDEGVMLSGPVVGPLRLKVYEVFNVGQIDGLPSQLYRHSWEIHPLNADERYHHAENFIRDLGVDIRTLVRQSGVGAWAFYSPTFDRIAMPPWELFDSGSDYYESLAHEVVHLATSRGRPADPGWPRVKARDLGRELVAEIGAAFLSVDLGISRAPRRIHASYINKWLEKEKHRVDAIYLFGAMRHAEAAVRWLHQEAPGYRLVPGITYRDDALSADDGMFRGVPDENLRLIAARDARRFVVAAEGLRRQDGRMGTAWQRAAVALLVEADSIDLDLVGVKAAVEAAVVVSGGAWVEAGAYIDGFRRETRRRLEEAVSVGGRWRLGGISGGRRM